MKYKLDTPKTVWLMALTVLSSAHVIQLEAATSPWTSANRIAISSDGNPDADADDIGATAFSLAMLAKAGLQDNLVHYDFNNFLEYKTIPAANNNMWISAMGAQNRWGFDAGRFFDAGIDPAGAVAHLTAEINKSTAADPLYLIAAGPMELTYQALKNADSTARQHVTIVSHHDYNEYFKPRLWQRNWNDIQTLVPTIGYLRIKDQNGSNGDGLKGSADSDFSWLDTHADANLNWVYDRVVAGKPDVSDAGMLAWLIGISGTDEKVTIPEMQAWFGAALIPDNGGSPATPPTPAGVAPTVVPPSTGHIFEEVGGKIVIEAESVPLTDDWILDTTEPGYSGSGYIRWMPSWINKISHQHEGVLIYKLRITNPGNYRMALRSSHFGAPERDKWNDCWTVMGLNPVNPYGITRKTYHSISQAEFDAGAGFTWHTTHDNYGAVAGSDGHFSQPLYNLDAGDHYFFICGRSGGFRIDKIHFFLEGVSGFKSDSEPVTPIIPGTGVPLVSAGNDQELLMPITGTQLAGSASDDDGTIVFTEWTQKSGPNTAVISTPSQLTTDITGITLGTYVFTLTVEDNDGNIRSDDVTVEFVGSLMIQEDDFSAYSGNINGDHWNPKWSSGTDQQRLCEGNGGLLTLDTTVAAENYHVPAKHPFALTVDGQQAVMGSDFRYTHMAGGEAADGLNQSVFALMFTGADNWWTGPNRFFSICNRGSGIGTLNTTGSDVIPHSALGVDTVAGGQSDWFRMEWMLERGEDNYVASAQILDAGGTVLYAGPPVDLGIANGTTLYGGYSTGGDGGNGFTTNVASFSRISSVQMDNFSLEVSSPHMTPVYEEKDEQIDFLVSEGFSSGALNGQQDWVDAASGWTVNPAADGTVNCSSANKNMTLGRGFKLNHEGDTLRFAVTYKVQGTHVPTGWKYLARIGVTTDAAGNNVGYDAAGTSLTAAMFTIQASPSEANAFRIYGDGWNGPFTDPIGSSAGDTFTVHYSLTLGADAASTVFSLQLENASQAASSTVISETDGVGEALFNAIKAGTAYVYFETGGLGDGITGVSVDAVEVFYSALVLDSYPGWSLGYGLSGSDAEGDYDYDGDGQSNLEEYIAGTHPDSSSSRFKIDSDQEIVGDDLIISWTSEPGRSYRILKSTNVVSETFTSVAEDIAYPQNSYTVDVSQAESGGFYKAEVRIP